jgi:hypothetical protein
MALTIGNQNATSGMTKDIYDEISAVMEAGLDVDDETLQQMREGWKKLAFAVATGVINHLVANLEISGVQTRGNISAAVSGNTAVASGHQHAVTLTGTQNNVTFTQSNNGTGRVS